MEDPVIFSPTTNQHFFVIFLHGRKSNPMIPAEIFGKNQYTKLKLTSDVSDRTWEVNLDGRRLAGGWEDFSNVHALQDDDVLIFKNNGDMTFHVTASGRSFCKVQCISSDEDDTWDEYSNSKKKPRTEAESSSENSYLVAHVTSANLRLDSLCLIKGFARSNGLHERCCEIGLMNQHGKIWTLGLRYNTTIDQAYIRGGWRDFCFVNGLEAGSFYKFKLVRNGAKPLLQLCSDTIPEGYCYKAYRKYKPSSECLASASMKQNKFLTITFKPYMLEPGQLRLPRYFVIENGITEAEEITLVDKNGVKWPSYVASANGQGGFYMAKGWRSFCAANNLKTGVTFTLEFVRGEGKTPRLKFCSKVKIEAQEEAQEETETRFQKRARVSEEGGSSRRTRASSKSSAEPRNLQCKKNLQSCSISDQVTKVKQGIVDTLSGIKRFRSELEVKERNLEGLLSEISGIKFLKIVISSPHVYCLVLEYGK